MPPYFSGFQSDFSARIHFGLQSGLDLVVNLPLFQLESGNYTGAPTHLINRWQREINHKLFAISGIPSTNG